jgi:amphi-Trp domain-containing protein
MKRSKEQGSSNVNAPINLSYAQKLRRDGAGFYLSELARGFLKGEVSLQISGKRFTIPAAEFVDVEIDLQERGGRYNVDVRVSWLRMPVIKSDQHREQKAG